MSTREPSQLACKFVRLVQHFEVRSRITSHLESSFVCPNGVRRIGFSPQQV